MSFSPEWLALREPADHDSVNAEVRDKLRARFAGKPAVRVVDLGCGAGSNLRGTWSALPAKQHWTLVDYDAKLLAEAKARLAQFGKGKPNGDNGLLLSLPDSSIDVAFKHAVAVLEMNRSLLEQAARNLLSKETLVKEDLETIRASVAVE